MSLDIQAKRYQKIYVEVCDMKRIFVAPILALICAICMFPTYAADAKVIANVNSPETLSYNGECLNLQGGKRIFTGHNLELYDFENLVWIYDQRRFLSRR
jgi:hypothetical protein